MSAGPTARSSIPEVRVSEYAERVLRRWYVVVLAVVVAVGVVRLHGVSSSKGQFAANAVVYMGQPLSPNGSPLTSTPYATAASVSKLITSPRALSGAARAAGVTTSSLQGRVTTHLLSTAASTTTGAKTNASGTYYEITAQGPWGRQKAAQIVAYLATQLKAAANTYVDVKLAQINTLIASETTTIKTLQTANQQARTLVDKLTAQAGSNPSDAALLGVLLSQISDNTNTLNTAQTQLSANRLAKATAQEIESARITTAASGHAVTATTRRSSLAVAAFVGLLIGVGLALAWDALRGATRPKAMVT